MFAVNLNARIVILLVTVCLLSDRASALAQPNQVVIGYSGTGITTDLRKVIDREHIWEKHNLSVKSVYFNSGSLMSQAMIGSSITASDSDVPAVMGLTVAGILDAKLIAVSINRLEHYFVVRKNIVKAEDLKGKRIAVSRLGSASDVVTRMVLRQWKIDPEKDVIFLQAGNTPTRITALSTGNVDAALVAPDNVHKVIATGCCRIFADLSELPMDYARFGVVVPTALIKSQRDLVRRLLMAFTEGIYVYKTKPKLGMSVIEEGGVKDPLIVRELYERIAKSLREYPVPGTKGVEGALDSLTHPNARTTQPASLMDTSIMEEIKKSGFIDKLYGRAS
jgi:NitT/TauT family transport system substrate-binding protein